MHALVTRDQLTKVPIKPGTVLHASNGYQAVYIKATQKTEAPYDGSICVLFFEDSQLSESYAGPFGLEVIEITVPDMDNPPTRIITPDPWPYRYAEACGMAEAALQGIATDARIAAAGDFSSGWLEGELRRIASYADSIRTQVSSITKPTDPDQS